MALTPACPPSPSLPPRPSARRRCGRRCPPAGGGEPSWLPGGGATALHNFPSPSLTTLAAGTRRNGGRCNGACPLLGGAGSGKATRNTRLHGDLPRSAQGDTKEAPGGSSASQAGGAEQPRRQRAPQGCSAISLPRHDPHRPRWRAPSPPPAIIPDNSPRAQLPKAGARRRRRPLPRPQRALASAAGLCRTAPPKATLDGPGAARKDKWTTFSPTALGLLRGYPQHQPRRRDPALLLLRATLPPFHRRPCGSPKDSRGAAAIGG